MSFIRCLATTRCQNSLSPLGIDCLSPGHPSNSVGTASSPCTKAAAAGPFVTCHPFSLVQFPDCLELSFPTKPWRAKIIIIKKRLHKFELTLSFQKYISLFCDFDNGHNTHCEKSEVIVHLYHFILNKDPFIWSRCVLPGKHVKHAEQGGRIEGSCSR